MGTCSHCDEVLTPQTASIPESIICYPAGTADPDKPGNRIVTEWVCKNHGIVCSPGGGGCGTVCLKGGPWDGRRPIWSPVLPEECQEVLVNGEVHLYKFIAYGEKAEGQYEYAGKKGE